MSPTRREFLGTTAAAGALLAAPALVTAAKAGKRHRTALVGSGWWGMNILREALRSEECEAVALCDVDDNQLDPALAEVGKLSSDQPRRYKDYRALIERGIYGVAAGATPSMSWFERFDAGWRADACRPSSKTAGEGR